jgi:hypothetical protein
MTTRDNGSDAQRFLNMPREKADLMLQLKVMCECGIGHVPTFK